MTMSEAAFQSLVTAAADRLQIPWYHVPDSRRSNPGFPDLVFGGGKAVLWRELKTDTGKTSPMQDFWIAVLQECGQDVAVWRPADWASGRVMAELKAIGKPRTPRPQPTPTEIRKLLRGRSRGLADG